MCREELQQYEENEDICGNCLSILSNKDIDGIEGIKVEDAVNRLRRNGQIFEPKPGRYRLSNM